MSIKYYHLAKDEALPDEFCAVRDVNGEPSEYTWYERMSEFERELWVLFNQSDWFAGSEYRKLQAENAKLRELVAHLMYVKPRDITGITYNGEYLRFDDLLAEVGMRWEDA